MKTTQVKGAHLSHSAPASTRAARRMTLNTTTSQPSSVDSTTTTSSPTHFFANTKALLSRRLGSRRPASTSFDHSPSPPLPSCPAPPLWLPLVDFLCHQVELHGVGQVGVFRTSAGANTVRQLLKACECLYRKRAGRAEMELLFAPHAREVDVVASVLKAYLREQSRPFLPVSLHDSLLAASEIGDIDERLYQLGVVISQLSRRRRRIFHRFILSLHRVQENQEENKMDASNLAIVFAPSLLRGDDDGLDIRRIRAQCQVIENCILYHAVVFQGENGEDGDGDEEDDDEDEGEEAVVEGVDVCSLAAAAPSVDHTNADGPTVPLGSHDFKKVAFNPFHLVACQHCHKAILGLGQAYQCQGCDVAVHRKCRDHAGQTCTAGAQPHRHGATSLPVAHRHRWRASQLAE